MRADERGRGATGVRVLALRLAALRFWLLRALLGDLRGLAGGSEWRARSLARPSGVRPLRRGGGFDPGHGPSRADRRPVGPPPVLGSLGGGIWGWYRPGGAPRGVLNGAGGPGY